MQKQNLYLLFPGEKLPKFKILTDNAAVNILVCVPLLLCVFLLFSLYDSLMGVCEVLAPCGYNWYCFVTRWNPTTESGIYKLFL